MSAPVSDPHASIDTVEPCASLFGAFGLRSLANGLPMAATAVASRIAFRTWDTDTPLAVAMAVTDMPAA